MGTVSFFSFFFFCLFFTKFYILGLSLTPGPRRQPQHQHQLPLHIRIVPNTRTLLVAFIQVQHTLPYGLRMQPFDLRHFCTNRLGLFAAQFHSSRASFWHLIRSISFSSSEDMWFWRWKHLFLFQNDISRSTSHRPFIFWRQILLVHTFLTRSRSSESVHSLLRTGFTIMPPHPSYTRKTISYICGFPIVFHHSGLISHLLVYPFLPPAFVFTCGVAFSLRIIFNIPKALQRLGAAARNFAGVFRSSNRWYLSKKN